MLPGVAFRFNARPPGGGGMEGGPLSVPDAAAPFSEESFFSALPFAGCCSLSGATADGSVLVVPVVDCRLLAVGLGADKRNT